MDNNKEVSIIVKWSGKEYPMTDLTEQDTVAVLKHEIFKATHVRPERQKLLNLRHKGNYITHVHLHCLKQGFLHFLRDQLN